MSVGIPEIDDDRKRFISLINEFNRSIVDRLNLSEIKRRLQLILAKNRAQSPAVLAGGRRQLFLD